MEMNEFETRAAAIVRDGSLGYDQKVRRLAGLATDALPYPAISADCAEALSKRVICDLFEGNAPYTARYILPDYEKAIRQGLVHLELPPPTNLDDALAFLQIMYAHVPSVTTYPVYLGDLDALLAKLDSLAPVLAEAAEARKAERAKQHEATRAAKEAMVAEAEQLAEGNDWRAGVNRFRTLLDQWRELPRIDRATDDALWHRFSSARTTYTRRRKSQFAEQAAKRDSSKSLKEQIIAEARELAGSTEWGPTSGAFRDLMTRWKAAGSAPRAVDEALWTEFRALQDQFFNARSTTLSEQDAEFKGNLDAKEALLVEAEATLVPVTDINQARAAYRSFLERYNAVGKVPRDSIRGLDNRIRALETAVKKAEEDEWRRTDPEARQRAEETVGMLSAEISKLQEKINKATARGDAQAAKKAQDSIDTYSVWLDQAKATLEDFTR
mgnify:CR=1 FL=1